MVGIQKKIIEAELLIFETPVKVGLKKNINIFYSLK